MNLVKEHWNKSNISEFQAYLKSFENKEKVAWATNLLRTELPVLCLTTPVIKKTIDELAKGNYLEFLDLMIWEYYENTAINGFLICKIADFNTMKKYLDIYSDRADNWATCDLLIFNVKDHEEEYFKLASSYVKNAKPFVKRIGLNILFNLIDSDQYIDSIYEILDQFKDEDFYYVNMMNAWLLSELFIKRREKTLAYLEHHNLNKFTINKGIQKCRESRRVSQEDKDMLLKYKVK